MMNLDHTARLVPTRCTLVKYTTTPGRSTVAYVEVGAMAGERLWGGGVGGGGG